MLKYFTGIIKKFCAKITIYLSKNFIHLLHAKKSAIAYESLLILDILLLIVFEFKPNIVEDD